MKHTEMLLKLEKISQTEKNINRQIQNILDEAEKIDIHSEHQLRKRLPWIIQRLSDVAQCSKEMSSLCKNLKEELANETIGH